MIDEYQGNKKIKASSPPRRGAEYVRMSTEHQHYSTENQQTAIREFADENNIEIVKTYCDGGRSGLSIHGRKALKRLIADVESGNVDFDIILVYDISRWGRFQNPDEAGYYEFICSKLHGIDVEYCAEQFVNDGTISSALMKHVKRVMAGEYSRELSVKVFRGQCRLIELGFRQGGHAGFGLRRRLVDHASALKAPPPPGFSYWRFNPMGGRENGLRGTPPDNPKNATQQKFPSVFSQEQRFFVKFEKLISCKKSWLKSVNIERGR